MVYFDLFKKLAEKDVRYLLCGGLAVSIYGIPRSTADIDLLLDFGASNLEKFESVMRELGYSSSLPVDLNRLSSDEYRKHLREEKNMLALSFWNQVSNIVHVDVLINLPFVFDDFWNRKNTRNESGLVIHLISPEDLIEMKSHSDRIQDKQDVINLLKLIKK